MFWMDGRETRSLLVFLKRFHMWALLFIPSSVSPVVYQPPLLSHTHTINTRSHTSCMPSGNLMGRDASRWSNSLSRCNPLMLNRCYFTVVPPLLRLLFPPTVNPSPPKNLVKMHLSSPLTEVRGEMKDAPLPVYPSKSPIGDYAIHPGAAAS